MFSISLPLSESSESNETWSHTVPSQRHGIKPTAAETETVQQQVLLSPCSTTRHPWSGQALDEWSLRLIESSGGSSNKTAITWLMSPPGTNHISIKVHDACRVLIHNVNTFPHLFFFSLVLPIMGFIGLYRRQSLAARKNYSRLLVGTCRQPLASSGNVYASAVNRSHDEEINYRSSEDFPIAWRARGTKQWK